MNTSEHRWASATLASRPAWIGRSPRSPAREPSAADGPSPEHAPGHAPVEVSTVNPGRPWSKPPALSVVLVVHTDLQRLIPFLEATCEATKHGTRDATGRATSGATESATGAATAAASARAGGRLGGEGGCQLIVVDAGSMDRTTSTMLSSFADTTLVRTARDLGPAWSYDIGLARAQGAVLLLADPGTRPTAEDIAALVKHLHEQPRCGVVSAGLCTPDGKALPGSCDVPTLRHLLVEESALARLRPNNPWRRRLRSLQQDEARGLHADCPPVGLLALRREALDEVGPLDTNLPWHAHHLDWFRRLRKAGWDVHLRADLRVPFEQGAPPDADDVWRRHRDRIRYARKHHGAWGVRCATLSLWSWALIEAGARLIGRGPGNSRGLLGAFDALRQARRTRAMA